jgi:hypothetical protein
MRCVICLILLGTLPLAACDKPEPVPLQVGDHAISIIFPQDWEHISYGDRHQFRQDLNRISLEDMGRLGRIDLALERAMVKLREDGRRENAWRDTLQISGRDARMVQTWDHLSHQYPKRYLFIVNDRSLLVVYTQSGQFEAMETAFTELTASQAFTDSLGVPGGGDQPE